MTTRSVFVVVGHERVRCSGTCLRLHMPLQHKRAKRIVKPYLFLCVEQTCELFHRVANVMVMERVLCSQTATFAPKPQLGNLCADRSLRVLKLLTE